MRIASELARHAATLLCSHLEALGISVRLASEPRKVKRLGSPLFGSEGHCFLDITESPFEWIDVAVWLTRGGEDGPNPFFYTRYSVPDVRLHRGCPAYALALAVSGPFHWKGKDSAHPIAEHFNRCPDTYEAVLGKLTSADASVRLVYGVNPLWINAFPKSEFWLISTAFPQQLLFPSYEGGPLDRDTWRSYERIADRLLHVPLPHETAA